MTLPQPDLIASAHSNKLIHLIQKEIQAEKGFISFARFMELALYTPGLGYYSAGAHKLGKGGDFVTAPEISPLFARTIARQCQQVLMVLGKGDILELGAGSGILAKDLLLELETLGTLPERYLILEVSADLRERQQQLLKAHCPHLFSRIIWLDRLPQAKISGVILANEVIDALPVQCFEINNNKIFERVITVNDDEFAWQKIPATAELTEQVQMLKNTYGLDFAYQSEINLKLSAWLNSLANSIKQGILLFFDYGYGQREYYHPDRKQGTLMCYYQHHKHSNPLVLVGLQDITAHVDFTRVAESAIQSGLSIGGYTTQAAFLFACGLLDLSQNPNLSEKEYFQQNQAIKTLTLPSQMGEAIKVIALSQDFDTPLIGFVLHDRMRDL